MPITPNPKVPIPSNTWYTPVPKPGDVDYQTTKTINAIQENLERLAGIRGDGGWSLITANNMMEKNYLEALAGQPQSIANIDVAPGQNPWGEIPPKPTDLHIITYSDTGLASPWFHHLEWDNPTDLTNVYYIEIWSSTIDDVGTSSRVAIVTPPQNSLMIYGVLISVDYYYWVRSISYGYKKSPWEPSPDTQGGYLVLGQDSVGETIDNIMRVLAGETPPAWDATLTYQVGDFVSYTSGDPSTTRKFKALSENLNTIPWAAGVTAAAWERTGILMTGEVDSVATVGIDGNLVVDGTILTRHLVADIIEASHILAGEITVSHIGDTSEILNENQIWSDISGTGIPADGADVTADQLTQSLADIDTATGRALAAINSADVIIAKVVSTTAAAPDGAGLYLGSDYMGYYNGSAWKTYMDNSGNFYLGGTSGALTWNGTTLAVSGNIVIASGLGITVQSGGGMTVQSGGNILLNSGGDLILTPHATNPSQITFNGSSYDVSFSMWTTTGSQLWLLPSVTNTVYFFIGSYSSDTPGSTKLFHSIYFRAYYSCWFRAQYSANYFSGLHCWSNSTGAVAFLVATQSGIGNEHFVQFKWMVEDGSLKFFVPSGHKTINSGAANIAWDDCSADDFANVADFYHFDDYDDLAELHKIKGSGTVDPNTGYEVIDDNTLPSILRKKAKIGGYSCTDPDNPANSYKCAEGEDLLDPDGKPYIPLKNAISHLWGCVRQLDIRVKDEKILADVMIQDLKDKNTLLEGEITKLKEK